MPPTPAEAVRAHVRAVSLSTLQRAISASVFNSNNLRGVSAQLAERACFDPIFRIWAADVAIRGVAPEPTAALKLITLSRQPASRPSFLVRTPILERIVGSLGESLATNEARVRKAWTQAERVTGTLGLVRLLDLLLSADLVAGLHGPWGEIRALSNPRFPGFVAIGIEGPPLLVAEQALHESAHVVVAARLAIDSELDEFLDERVGILSPFTDSCRTIERVVHGIVSYSVVEAMWRAVMSTPTLENWMEISDRSRTRGIAERRARTINARVRLAMRCLFDGAGVEICRRTVMLLEDLAHLEGPPLPSSIDDRREIVANAGYSTGLASLTAIERAEAALAIFGTKVSRISIPLANIPRVGFALAARVPVAASSWVIYSIPDPKLGGFSNVSGESSHVIDATPEAEVHLYLHPDPLTVQRAAVADLQDLAGELLGIPGCCREWFVQAWPEARKSGGDLFAAMARQAARNGQLAVAPECDASAMYRGGGLCWHFPCSPRCAETIEIVSARRRVLAECDPQLLAELDQATRSVVTILSDGTYIDEFAYSEGSVVIDFEDGVPPVTDRSLHHVS